MNQTQNYQLSQWESTDRILMSDFNSDNAKLDAALKEHGDELAALTAAADGFGNCRVYYTMYTGTGTESVTMTFPKKPLLVIVGGAYTLIMLQGGVCGCFSVNGAGESFTATWEDNSVTWTGSPVYKICNTQNAKYPLIALMAEDEA